VVTRGVSLEKKGLGKRGPHEVYLLGAKKKWEMRGAGMVYGGVETLQQEGLKLSKEGSTGSAYVI